MKLTAVEWSFCRLWICIHWLIIKAVWQIARQDKTKWSNPTEGLEEEGKSKGRCEPATPQKQGARGPEKQWPCGST